MVIPVVELEVVSMTSYGDDDGFNAWLASQGLTLPADAPDIAVLRSIGSIYIDAAYGYKLTCSRRTGGWEQELEFPRTGHRVNGQAVPSDLIPAAWVNASYRAAYLEATTKGWATGSVNPNRVVKRQKVDTIEREFFAASDNQAGDAAAGVNTDAIINAMVLPWLCKQGLRDPNSLFRVI